MQQFTLEEIVQKLYTAKTKNHEDIIDSVVDSVKMILETPSYKRYELKGQIRVNEKESKNVSFTFDIKKIMGASILKKMATNIALIRPAVKSYGGKEVSGASFLGLFVSPVQDKINIGEDSWSFKEVNNAILNETITKDIKFKPIVDFKLMDRSVEKMKLIMNVDSIDPSIINKTTWNYIVNISVGKTEFGRDLPVTPFDIELFDYQEGLVKHLQTEWKRIRNDIFALLALHENIYPSSLMSSVNKFFLGNMTQLKMIQTTQDSNPLTMVSQKNKVYFFQDISEDKVPVNSPFMDGILDPIRTAEGGAGVNRKNELTIGCKFDKNEASTLVYDTNFNEKRIPMKEYLNNKILSYENINYRTKQIKRNSKGVYKYALRSRYYESNTLDGIKYYRHPYSLLSVSTATIPMVSRTDSIRVLLASHFNTQAIPVVASQPSIIKTTYSKQLYKDSPTNIKTDVDGEIIEISPNKDTVKILQKNGEIHFISCNEENSYKKYNMTLNHTYNIYEPVVKLGEKVKVGDIIFALNSFKEGELALNVPLFAAFTTLRAYEEADGWVLSESAAVKFSHKELMNIELRLVKDEYKINDKSILPKIGTRIDKDTVICSYIVLHDIDETIAKIFNSNQKVEETVEYKLPEFSVNGKIADVDVFANPKLSKDQRNAKLDEYQKQCLKSKKSFFENPVYGDKKFPQDEEYEDCDYVIKISVEYYNRLKLSDKLTNRVSNKGVVVEILPDSEMPRTLDGHVVECIMPALSMAKRKNAYGIYECKITKLSKRLFDLASKNQITLKHIPIFKYMYPTDANIDKYVKGNNMPALCKYLLNTHSENGFFRLTIDPFDTELSADELDEYLALVGIPNGGKEYLIDGKTGKQIRNPLLTGYEELMRLHFVAEIKGYAVPEVTYTEKVVMGVGKHHKEGPKFGEQEAHALLSAGAEDVLIDLTKEQGKEKDAATRSEFISLLMRIRH